MGNSSDKLKANKFALIYEFNNDSPLFARVAADLIKENEFEKAIEILEKGLSLYPAYPTPYFIYAKALAYVGNSEKAKEMIQIGSDFIQSEKTKEFYLNEINEISSSHFNGSNRVAFLEPEAIENIELGDEDVPEPEKPKEFEDRLEEVAGQLENAKIAMGDEPQADIDMDSIDDLPEEEANDFDIAGEEFISETLAGIYFAQKNYKAAQNIFVKLIALEPEKEEYYQSKIQEIDDILNRE
ncbi:MAG: tetratricopeptide repeat protein [Chlorobi bacterium]|nr:tetratricopeptide repeat protein [Chlorobiota bacterium]